MQTFAFSSHLAYAFVMPIIHHISVFQNLSSHWYTKCYDSSRQYKYNAKTLKLNFVNVEFDCLASILLYTSVTKYMPKILESKIKNSSAYKMQCLDASIQNPCQSFKLKIISDKSYDSALCLHHTTQKICQKILIKFYPSKLKVLVFSLLRITLSNLMPNISNF